MIPFLKMHGCGNDFVVLDARKDALPLLNWKKLADRHFGIGCDQVVVLEPSSAADVLMRIINADGSESGACGNASRCVAWLLGQERGAKDEALVSIETLSGVIHAWLHGQQVTIDMGKPMLDWVDIPLSHEVDTLHLPVSQGVLHDGVGVSMGNPHAVFFVQDTYNVPLEELGTIIENNKLFPERANVGAAQVVDSSHIRLRVWERGSGLTLACGTGACAALVAASRRGLTGRRARVELSGGMLDIDWRDDGHVYMTGDAVLVFNGQLDPAAFGV